MTPKKLSPEIAKMLNERINDEYGAYYFYRQVANYCENVGFLKAAKYFNDEAIDEQVHSQIVQKYLTDWNVQPSLMPIEPPVKVTGLVDAIEKAYEKEYPIAHHVQSWATDMWTVLWEYWRTGNTTIVHDELKFSWATDNVSNYFKQNIFHLAGVNAKMDDKFYKGAYHTKNVFKEYLRNPAIFDKISPLNATYEYVAVLKRYASTLKSDPTVYRFNLEVSKPWGSIYRRDDKKFFGRSLWRSIDNKYTIFFNKKSWILTSTKYESQFSETCGGFASNPGGEPYDDCWNIPGTKVSVL